VCVCVRRLVKVTGECVDDEFEGTIEVILSPTSVCEGSDEARHVDTVDYDGYAVHH
jgi:hypothetical protein